MISIRIGLMLALILASCEALAQQGSTTQSQDETVPRARILPPDETAVSSSPAEATVSTSHPHGATDSVLRLNDGQRWIADAPLTVGMARIRAAVQLASELPRLDQESAALLVQTVRNEVNFLIINCRLQPAADATLHVFIAQLLSAATSLRNDPASVDGLPRMQQVLLEYPQYFAHPGWQAVSVEGRAR